jgi:hypothetical protein
MGLHPKGRWMVQSKMCCKRFKLDSRKRFKENHAPIVSDATLHFLLAIKTSFELSSGQFNIETAFLYRGLVEELWMAIPDGYTKFMKEKPNTIVDLKTQSLKSS